MTSNRILRTTIVTLLVALLSLGAVAGSALADESRTGPDDLPKFKQAPEPLPPNCEIVTIVGEPLSISYIDCHLPPECEVVTIEGEDFNVSWIECDIPHYCELQSGDWHGHTYWEIVCFEDAVGDPDPLPIRNPYEPAFPIDPDPEPIDDFTSVPPEPITPVGAAKPAEFAQR